MPNVGSESEKWPFQRYGHTVSAHQGKVRIAFPIFIRTLYGTDTKLFFFCIIEINHNAFWAVKSIKLWSKAISKAVKKRFTNPFLSCHNFSYAHLYKIIIHFYACWLLCFFNNNINSEKSASHIYCSLPKIVRTLVYLMYITRRLYTNYSTHT